MPLPTWLMLTAAVGVVFAIAVLVGAAWLLANYFGRARDDRDGPRD